MLAYLAMVYRGGFLHSVVAVASRVLGLSFGLLGSQFIAGLDLAAADFPALQELGGSVQPKRCFLKSSFDLPNSVISFFSPFSPVSLGCELPKLPPANLKTALSSAPKLEPATTAMALCLQIQNDAKQCQR